MHACISVLFTFVYACLYLSVVYSALCLLVIGCCLQWFMHACVCVLSTVLYACLLLATVYSCLCMLVCVVYNALCLLVIGYRL